MELCANCKTEFDPGRHGRLYCTPRCREQARWRRKYEARRDARREDGAWRSGGFVYLIQEGQDGPVKIGWARDPQDRLERMQTGNSRVLRLVCSFPGGIGHERALHREFAAHHIRGEWFEPAPELLALVKSLGAASSRARRSRPQTQVERLRAPGLIPR